jgi:hypothetical protein
MIRINNERKFNKCHARTEHKQKFGAVIRKIDVLTKESLINIMTTEHKQKFGQ